MKNQTALEILHLEDDSSDAVLIDRALKRQGLACHITWARNKEEFEAGLGTPHLDLILSDCRFPGYDGLQALHAAKARRPELPFLFVSGTIGEERAVETLKAGAADYILKDHLERLGSAVVGALRQASERAWEEKTEKQRAELEERLRQAQKLEAIGRVTGGVAHDFNNLLVVIRGYAEMLLMSQEQLSLEGQDWLKQVIEAAQRASGLTRQLLMFGRKQPMEPRDLDLNALVEEMLKMLRRVIEANIQLECEYGQGLPHIKGDRGMLEQVLMNLVVNARDAMPDGGKLTIRTERVEIGAEAARVSAEARPGQFLCLSVTDTGTGIAAEHLPRIFEPFFTTKKAGMGTGLGLATVYGIIKQHEGWVEVSSELGKGSVFRILLPALADASQSKEVTAAQADLPRGNEKILLAEDDESVRLLAVRMLSKLGYQVVEANSGKTALEAWMKAGADFDLLLTDIVMPDGFTGRELAEKLRAVKPGLKIIFVSGYARGTGLNTDFFQRYHSEFLQKPYSPVVLAQTIRKCLDSVIHSAPASTKTNAERETSSAKRVKQRKQRSKTAKRKLKKRS